MGRLLRAIYTLWRLPILYILPLKQKMWWFKVNLGVCAGTKRVLLGVDVQSCRALWVMRMLEAQLCHPELIPQRKLQPQSLTLVICTMGAGDNNTNFKGLLWEFKELKYNEAHKSKWVCVYMLVSVCVCTAWLPRVGWRSTCHWETERGKMRSLSLSLSLSLSVAVQPLSCVRLFETIQTATCQAPLSFTISWSLLRFISIESVMPSNHLILCHPLLLLPSIFPRIRVFFNESALRIRWPKYCSFSFSISPSNKYSWLVSFGIYWFDLIYSVCLLCLKKSFCPHVSIFISLFWYKLRYWNFRLWAPWSGMDSVRK